MKTLDIAKQRFVIGFEISRDILRQSGTKAKPVFTCMQFPALNAMCLLRDMTGLQQQWLTNQLLVLFLCHKSELRASTSKFHF